MYKILFILLISSIINFSFAKNNIIEPTTYNELLQWYAQEFEHEFDGEIFKGVFSISGDTDIDNNDSDIIKNMIGLRALYLHQDEGSAHFLCYKLTCYVKSNSPMINVFGIYKINLTERSLEILREDVND